MNEIFDEWIKDDIGKIYVQIFDMMLGLYMGNPASLCVHTPTCRRVLALEHNGNLYSCDHFVFPENLLGNINEIDLTDMVDGIQQTKFGQEKGD